MNKGNSSKSVSNVMKLFKMSAIGTILLSVGSTYTFNSNKAFAKTSQNESDQVTTSPSKDSEIMTVSKSMGDDAPTFVITPGKSSDTNITPEQKEKLKDSENQRDHDILIEKHMSKIEKEKAPVKGAKIKKYTNYQYNDYVKNGNVYEYYKVYWTKTKKVSYVGIPVRKASSYDTAFYSKSGNHIDSSAKAKLTSNQKKIINTLKKSKAYSKKYRYIALYRYNTAAKTTDLYILPKSGKSAHYEISKHFTAFSYDNKDNIVIASPKTHKDYINIIKTGYALNILPHIATAKAWEVAFGGGYHKLFHGYRIVDSAAFKAK